MGSPPLQSVPSLGPQMFFSGPPMKPGLDCLKALLSGPVLNPLWMLKPPFRSRVPENPPDSLFKCLAAKRANAEFFKKKVGRGPFKTCPICRLEPNRNLPTGNKPYRYLFPPLIRRLLRISPEPHLNRLPPM